MAKKKDKLQKVHRPDFDRREKNPLNKSERREIRDRLTWAIYNFFDSYPLYYYILCGLPRVERMDLRTGTMAVGFTRGSIPALYYDPYFVNELTDEQVQIILHHEAQHLGLRHIQRFNDLKDMTPDDGAQLPLSEKMKVANIAADIVVNHHIPNLDKLPEWLRNGMVTKERFEKIIGQIDVHSTPFEEIYYKLLNGMEKQEVPMPSMSPDGTGGSGIDDHETWEEQGDQQGNSGDKEKKEGKGLTPEQQAALDDLVRDSVQKLGSKHPGNVPGLLERIIEKIKKVRLNWRQQISIFAQSIADEQRISTWKKLNRRMPFSSPGRKREYNPKMLVALDNSGSTYGVYDLFMSHILKISETVEIDIVGCDTRINFEFKLREGKLPTNFADPNSGGGTMAQPVFDYAKEKGNYDGIIYLTDGYIFDNFNTYGIPTLFAVGPGGQHLEGHRNVDIPEEDNEDFRDAHKT